MKIARVDVNVEIELLERRRVRHEGRKRLASTTFVERENIGARRRLFLCRNLAILKSDDFASALATMATHVGAAALYASEKKAAADESIAENTDGK